MFHLPPSLARHFRDETGRTDYRTLLRTPDGRLLELARRMPAGERAELYHRLRALRLGWFEAMAARAAGVDVDAQRRRFLHILEAAAETPETVTV